MNDSVDLEQSVDRIVTETGYDRQLFRTTTVGDIPYGVDGRKSKSLEGAPLLAA